MKNEIFIQISIKYVLQGPIESDNESDNDLMS